MTRHRKAGVGLGVEEMSMVALEGSILFDCRAEQEEHVEGDDTTEEERQWRETEHKEHDDHCPRKHAYTQTEGPFEITASEDERSPVASASVEEDYEAEDEGSATPTSTQEEDVEEDPDLTELKAIPTDQTPAAPSTEPSSVSIPVLTYPQTLPSSRNPADLERGPDYERRAEAVCDWLPCCLISLLVLLFTLGCVMWLLTLSLKKEEDD